MMSIVSYTDTSSDDDEPESSSNDQSCGVNRETSSLSSAEVNSSGSVCCDYEFGFGTDNYSGDATEIVINKRSCDCVDLKKQNTTKRINADLGPNHHYTECDNVHDVATRDGRNNEKCVHSMSMISTNIDQRAATVTQGAPKHSLPIFENHEEDTKPLPKKMKTSGQDGKQKQGLILPDSVKSMFGRPQQWVDNSVVHGNRVRSFPHVEGNWATHVYIPVSNDERLISFIDQLLMCLRPVKFEAMSEFHVSLSHTVVVRHHWIDPLVDSLRENFKVLNSVCDLAAVKLYRNDERTRTFVGLELSQDETFLMEYVKAVNRSFKEFKLRSYYEKPLFHVSIGWCLGDELDKVTDDMLNKAKEMLADFCAANPELSILFVQHICCKTGNKSFVLPLADSTR